MSADTLLLTDELHDYLVAISRREPPVLAELRERSSRMAHHNRQIAPEQAQLMALLAGLAGARRVLEVGTFRGYSALALALALPDDGTVVTCDIDPSGPELAREHWRRAGVEDRIDVRIGPALETLDRMLADEGAEETFDFAFIDADKRNHDGYYERALRLVRRGGVIVLDNVFWEGRVIDPAFDDPDTEGIRALNLKLRDDERVSISTVPLSDGLTIAVRR